MWRGQSANVSDILRSFIAIYLFGKGVSLALCSFRILQLLRGTFLFCDNLWCGGQHKLTSPSESGAIHVVIQLSEQVRMSSSDRIWLDTLHDIRPIFLLNFDMFWSALTSLDGIFGHFTFSLSCSCFDYVCIILEVTYCNLSNNSEIWLQLQTLYVAVRLQPIANTDLFRNRFPYYLHLPQTHRQHLHQVMRWT